MIVYLITNTVNGKRYVGQTKFPLTRRLWIHAHSPNCPRLFLAIRKYGRGNFSIEPIVEVPTRELANEFESEFIERYCTRSPNGYNLTAGGRVPRHNEETRLKMSLSKLGKPSNHRGKRFSEEAKELCRQRMLGNTYLLGYRHSEETKLRIANSVKKVRANRFWSTRKVES